MLETGRTQRILAQRFDVRDRDGVFRERWWAAANIPVFSDDGRLEAILHHVTNVTARHLETMTALARWATLSEREQAM